jgi:hypothetical protein
MVVALVLAVVAMAQEKITLNVPVFQSAGASDFRLQWLYLKRQHPDSPAEIRAIFREVEGFAFVPHGRELICLYTNDEAEMLVRALNTTNLSTVSLERRVTARCQQDGKLGAGTISGTPE